MYFTNDLTKEYIFKLLKKSNNNIEIGTIVSDYSNNHEQNKTNELPYKFKGQYNTYFSKIIKKYDLINCKNIPYIYKCNSVKNRLELLGGIIDNNPYLKINQDEISLLFNIMIK